MIKNLASTALSHSALVQRLLRDILGLSTKVSISVDSLEERIEKVALLIVDKLIQECLQEHTATLLGEPVA